MIKYACFQYVGNINALKKLCSFRNEIYIAPSGVQKERILPEDLFVQDIDGKDIKLPPSFKCLKKSQCTPLFMCAYKGNLN